MTWVELFQLFLVLSISTIYIVYIESLIKQVNQRCFLIMLNLISYLLLMTHYYLFNIVNNVKIRHFRTMLTSLS